MTVVAEKPKPRVTPPKVSTQKMLIGGQWVESKSGKTFPTVNPATGETICQVAEGDKADVDLAVKAARKAFEQGPWPKMSAAERGRRAAIYFEKNGAEALTILDQAEQDWRSAPGRPCVGSLA